jgi:hypothetical protein
LRNAGATYQRCMNHVFGEHIGRTVEAYVDDIVVKTRKASDLHSDLEVTLWCLKAKGVKLNPEKCVFGVPRAMLLGFIVSERGIEANPEKIAAITNMGPIKDLKGVQRVTRNALRPRRSQTTPPRPRGLHPAGALARTHRNKAQPRKAGPLAKKCDKSLQASINTPFEARGLLSGTIIRGTPKTPKSQLVTPISIKLQRPDGCD